MRKELALTIGMDVYSMNLGASSQVRGQGWQNSLPSNINDFGIAFE
jgi:hypothetical protein